MSERLEESFTQIVAKLDELGEEDCFGAGGWVIDPLPRRHEHAEPEDTR